MAAKQLRGSRHSRGLAWLGFHRDQARDVKVTTLVFPA